MRNTFVATITGFALFSTIAMAQNITFDFDKAADFSQFKTYAWIRGTNVDDELNHKRIVGAVNTQLTSKGIARVERNANPDVLVAYHATFDRDLQINGFSSGWGGYRFGGNRSGTLRTEQIVVGTLVVDMVDARTETIVWRGTATREIDPIAKADKRDKNINTAAQKLFRNYPPTR